MVPCVVTACGGVVSIRDNPARVATGASRLGKTEVQQLRARISSTSRSPGFRSRCTIPARCAALSASAIWIAIASASAHGRAALPLERAQPIGERLTFEHLHHEISDAFVLADVLVCRKHDSVRHTKIIATLGPASRTPDVLDALIAAGVEVFRLNFSHGTQSEHAALFHLVREAARAPIGTSP